MGHSMRIGPCTAARNTARIWVRNMMGSAKQRRMPVKPKAGFKASPWLNQRGFLSTPKSTVRKVSGLPFMRLTASK